MSHPTRLTIPRHQGCGAPASSELPGKGQANQTENWPVSQQKRYRFEGHCPICGQDTVFEAAGTWFRDQLSCKKCPSGSVPRERALALILNEQRPDWRELSIHESSPSPRGISAVMRRQCANYMASQYFPDRPFGSMIRGVRNENLEAQTFANESFDIVVSLDVMEHVYLPDKVFSEVHRTLKPGGVYLCTFPVRKNQVVGWQRRFLLNEDGSRTDIEEPEIHGNPISKEGSIVTIDYGYDLHQAIAEWAPFDVRVYRFADRHHGILGEYTEVVMCKKSGIFPSSRPAETPNKRDAGFIRRFLTPRMVARWRP